MPDSKSEHVISTISDVRGLEKMTEALKKQGEESQAVKHAHEKLDQVVEKLSDDFPLVGIAAQAVFSPVKAAINTLVKVLVNFKEEIAALANRSTPEFERLTEAVHKQKEAMEEVELMARAYDRALARLAIQGESVQAASQAYTATLRSQADAEIALSEKSQARKSAVIEAAEKFGMITHAEAILAKLKLDEDYAKKREAIESRLAHKQLQEKYREQIATDIETMQLEKALGGKRQAAKQSSGKAAFAVETAEADRKNLEKTKEKLAELEKEGEEFKGFHPVDHLTPAWYARRAQNEKEQLDQQRIAEGLRRKIQQDDERVFRTKDAAKAAQEDLEADEARLRKDKERLVDLQRGLPREQAAVDDADSQRQALNAESSGARQAQGVGELAGTPEGRLIASGAALDQAKSLDSQHQSQLNQLVSLLAGVHGNTLAVTQALAESTKDVASLKNEIELLKQRQNASKNTYTP